MRFVLGAFDSSNPWDREVPNYHDFMLAIRLLLLSFQQSRLFEKTDIYIVCEILLLQHWFLLILAFPNWKKNFSSLHPNEFVELFTNSNVILSHCEENVFITMIYQLVYYLSNKRFAILFLVHVTNRYFFPTSVYSTHAYLNHPLSIFKFSLISPFLPQQFWKCWFNEFPELAIW